MCKRILASQTNSESGVPFYKIGTIGGVPDAYISKELFESYRAKYSYPRKGEVMITCAGTVGKAMIFDGHDSYYQDSNIVWIDNPTNKINNTFLYHFISKVDWSKLNTTTIVRIYNDDLRQLKISYPTLTEQRKISIFLDLLNKRIQTQKKIIEDLKKLKDAINNSLHNNINEFQLFSFSELGNDYSGLIGKSSDDFGSGLPYISYLNVFRNDIVTDGSFDCVKVSKTEKQNVVSYGDLLFTLSSETPSEVGIGAIYLGKTNPLYLNSFCFGVHLSNHENIYGPYLAYFVTSQYFRRTILPFAQGSTRYNLMKSDFMKHKFCFPNMATQKAIYNALHTLSEKIQNEEVSLNKFAEQKQYLLSRLFI